MAVSDHKRTFAILYSKFILGGYAYVFTDTGADTMQINYAQYGLFFFSVSEWRKWLRVAGGLGMDVSSYYPAYLIPYNLLIPACSTETSSMGCSCICLSEDDNDFPLLDICFTEN